MKARIEFLRDLQKKYDDREEDFNKELEALNAKYQALYGESLSIVWTDRLATKCSVKCKDPFEPLGLCCP